MRAGELHVEAGWVDAFARAGLQTVDGVLARATCIRDLPDRANLVLDVASRRIFLKCSKRGPSREWALARWARDEGLPTAEPVFAGLDAGGGEVCGFADLAPARPLDDLLREDALGPATRRVVLATLAATVARLHALRRHHRDLYLNHVYVDPEAARPVAGIVDWERAGPHWLRLSRWVVKDLAALDSSVPEGAVSHAERTRFLVRYLRALPGADPRRHLAGLARRVEHKAARIRAHVPRTPVGEAARP